MRRFPPIRLALVLPLALVAACGPRANTVTVAGSTAFQPFAERLAEEMVKRSPGYSITVQGGGSALGIQAALSGAAQIGMADLVSLPEEAAGLDSVVVARDAIVLVTHPDNPITGLTLGQIRDVYNGKVESWSALGGPDRPIHVVSRESGSGTRTSFEQIVGGIDLSTDALIQDSNGSIRETVAADPDAIGYVSHGLVNDRIKPLAVDGVSPTAQEIAGSRYVLVRPIFLLTSGARSEACQAFLDFVLGPVGQALILSNGLLPAR